MKSWQRTALNYHCRFAFETVHPRFVRVVRHTSIIVTVNSGYE